MPSLITIRDNCKIFESNDLNYCFNLKNGYTELWGKNKNDDPPYSKYGPLIADIEITTKCGGIKGIPCSYCYKSNTSIGQNLSFENFQKIIKKINRNGQLQQVAFGLGATAEENPDLWDMCKYLRSKFIIPNGTVANVSDETAKKIATNFGAVAISYHDNFEVLAENCKRFAPYILGNHYYKNNKSITLSQLNIHFVIMEETYEDCKKLFELRQKDIRFMAVNAIVLLGLKKCGRAENGNFHKISDAHFKELVDIAFEQKMGIGFDSCSANKLDNVIKNRSDYNELVQMIEPCESKLFSVYLNQEGKVYPCSFNEKNRKGFDLLQENDFLNDYWNNDSDGWRKSLTDSGRSCPVYDV